MSDISIHYVLSLAAIPVTISQIPNVRAETDVTYHPSYKGTVLFQNVFHGQLPATDYPKVNVGIWAFLSWINSLLLVLFCDVPHLLHHWWCLGLVLLSSPSWTLTNSSKWERKSWNMATHNLALPFGARGLVGYWNACPLGYVQFLWSEVPKLIIHSQYIIATLTHMEEVLVQVCSS